MRIISLDEVSRKEILDQLLKRSPNHYGQYLDTVAEIVERVRRDGDRKSTRLNSSHAL